MSKEKPIIDKIINYILIHDDRWSKLEEYLEENSLNYEDYKGEKEQNSFKGIPARQEYNLKDGCRLKLHYEHEHLHFEIFEPNNDRKEAGKIKRQLESIILTK